MSLKVRREREPVEIHWDALVISVGLALGVGFLGSLATVGAIPTWYAQLHKPFFTPPGWLFGPVWTLLYIGMGLATYFVWVKHHFSPKAQPFYTTYLLQLLLNLSWSLVFFGAHNPRLALAIIVALWYAIYLLLQKSSRLVKFTEYFLWPYLAWVSFAGILNLAIVFMN